MIREVPELGVSDRNQRGVGRDKSIDEVFAGLRRDGRVGLMTHIVFGHPTVEASRHIVGAMARSGVDMIEVQIPFSDPTADGPIITAACQKALDRGARVQDGIDFVAEVSRKHQVPILFMSYFNVVFNYRSGPDQPRGTASFARAAAAAGAGGIIVPDIPPEEDQEEFPQVCRQHGLHPIYVTSPNVNDDRLRAISRVASGFLYCTSRTGTTGRDMQVEMGDLGRFLARARDICQLPLVVGFSLSRRDQVDALRGHADMAVVGSHLIRIYEKFGLSGLEREVRILAGRKD